MRALGTVAIESSAVEGGGILISSVEDMVPVERDPLSRAQGLIARLFKFVCNAYESARARARASEARSESCIRNDIHTYGKPNKLSLSLAIFPLDQDVPPTTPPAGTSSNPVPFGCGDDTQSYRDPSATLKPSHGYLTCHTLGAYVSFPQSHVTDNMRRHATRHIIMRLK